MAAGKGFGTSPMGFNKQEVNEYIASLSKRMSELESEKKEIEKKYESAKKIVDGAEDKVKEVEKSSNEKIEQLEEQIRNEHKNTEGLIDQIDELKRKLKNAGSSAGASSGASVNTAAAEKRAAEIIASAEKKAKETIASANKKAEQIVEKAKRNASETAASSAVSRAKVDMSGFTAKLREFAESVNSGCKALLDKAAEISEINGEAAAEMPDFSAFDEYEADVPETNAYESNFGGSSDRGDQSGMDEINALLSSMTEDSTQSEEMNADVMDETGDDMNMSFGFDAMDDFKADNRNDSPDVVDVGDLDSGMTLNDEDLSGNNEPDSSFDLSFGEDLLSGFSEDSSADVDSDLSDTVEADDVNSSADDFGTGNEMDEMQKLLEQAELTFGSGPSEFEEKTSEVSEAADDWSSLQNELDALEKNNGFDEDMSSSSGADENPENDIWSLGDTDMSESDDDDMSSDLFGSF